jgi:hypothetical protein
MYSTCSNQVDDDLCNSAFVLMSSYVVDITLLTAEGLTRWLK